MATLRVTLLRASDLAVSDSGLEGATSDPFVVLGVGKEIQQSSCLQQQLDPVWRPRETFDFPVVHADSDVLRVDVYDYDTFNAHDLLGSLVLPVSKFTQYPNLAQHETYHLDVPPVYGSQACSSTIELEISFLPDARDGALTLRLWENEVWALTTGWAASDTAIYRRFSSYDDAETSHRFEDVAPSVPDGMDGEGWNYISDVNRGDNGWLYAHNFLGPFAAEKTMSSYVRRRLWQNTCVANTQDA